MTSGESKTKNRKKKHKRNNERSSTTMRPSGEVVSETTEDVLVVPQQLTQSAYATLKRCHAVPHTFHLEGRFGSRTHRIDSTHIGLPIISKEILKQRAENNQELQALIETPGTKI
jgi:hypothetical protein